MSEQGFSAKRLLELYDHVAEAPDAIERLRKFVLELAVRGRLVEKDPEDESASKLLEQIAVERARLSKAGEIKKPKPSSPVDSSEFPIEIPDHWALLRLREIGLLSGGMTPSKDRPDYWDGDVVWLSPKDIKADEVSDSELKITTKGLSETRLELFPVGSLFIVARSGILKHKFPVAINRVPAASNQDIKVLVPFLKGQARYLQIMFRGLTDFLLTELVKTGTTVQSLKYTDFEVQPFPLPPIGEQQRIVAKVDKFMALLNRLETTFRKREVTRDRLTKASFVCLTTPDTTSDSFPVHTHFAVDTLRELTTRPNQIEILRQSIVSLGVQGKLVEQDPADEPASELLKRIAAEKNRLQIKQSVSALREGEAPFELPPGWSWARIGEICSKTGSGSTPRGGKAAYRNAGIPFLRSQNIYNNGLRLEEVAFIDRKVHERMKGTKVIPCDLLLNITGGSIGRCCLVPSDFEEANISQHVAIIRPAIKGMERFLHKFVLSPHFQFFIFDEQTGAGRGGLPKRKMDKILVALPPLAEQYRIVAKVDLLMALCDRLEAALTATDTKRTHLLESLLRNALNPTTNSELVVVD